MCGVLQKPTSEEDAFNAERSALAERLVDAIGAGITSDEEFNQLALSVFHHQMRWNRPYAQFVKSEGASDVTHWSQIPSVATDVFKLESMPVVCGSAERAQYRFRTSGTTGEVRGTHLFHSLDVYEASSE